MTRFPFPRLCLARQPEVEEFRSRRGQHDVARLEIPVDDPLPVRLVQGIRDQEVDPVLAADIEDRADVGMAECRDRFRFALEPLLRIGVRSDVLREDFDGAGAVEAGVGSFLDLAHAGN